MVTNQISSKRQLVSQVAGSIESDMDGEKVLLSISNSKYYNMGKIGGEIWERIKEPVSITDLVASLKENYEVEQNECEEQVIFFLNLLSEEGLIRLESTPVS